jgi:hypothetical protein
MEHHTTPQFWERYHRLPQEIQELADRNHELLQENPKHPSLHFKQVAGLWSVRIGRDYRALGIPRPGAVFWFWIGSHADYDQILARR